MFGKDFADAEFFRLMRNNFAPTIDARSYLRLYKTAGRSLLEKQLSDGRGFDTPDGQSSLIRIKTSRGDGFEEISASRALMSGRLLTVCFYPDNSFRKSMFGVEMHLALGNGQSEFVLSREDDNHWITAGTDFIPRSITAPELNVLVADIAKASF